nr:hypothetical protein CFP56_13643 [Quercus suber]
MGVFTTQSAYKTLANSAMANNASSSNPNPQKQFWRGLWKLQVPDKMKTNPANPEESHVDKTDGGNVYASSVGLEVASEAGKNFEVTLDELDKEIAMFDGPTIRYDEILNPLGPLISGPSNSTPLPNSIGPLANISNLSPSHDNPVPKASSQWARIKRQVGKSDESEALNVTLGRKYTWKGKRGNSMILERLDRAFATPSWLEFFPATRVQHLHSNASDHDPIIIKPEGIVPCPKKPFHFESMWMKEEGCRNTIVDAWGVPSFASNMLLALSKMVHCGEKLTVWSWSSFGSIKRQLAEASKRLVLAEEAAARGGSYDQVRILKLSINDLLDKESMMWIQRARSLYLQTRDSNTRYFHNRASQRYKRNRIHGLQNDQHTWCTAEHQIKEIATAFFQDLFTTSSPEEGHPIFESILPVVTLDMNRDLNRSFSRD